MFIMIGKRTIIVNQGLSWKSVGISFCNCSFDWTEKNYLFIRYQRL